MKSQPGFTHANIDIGGQVQYQMAEAVEILSDAWIEDLKKDIPKVYYATFGEGCH